MPLTFSAGVIKNNTEAVSNDIERIDELSVEELAKLWRGMPDLHFSIVIFQAYDAICHLGFFPNFSSSA